MNDFEQEQLKQNLREMIAGRNDGIELDSDFRWVVSGAPQLGIFFQCLPLILPPDAILHFEGCEVSRDMCAFYEANEAPESVAVMRDTISPVSECFHVIFSREILAKLSELTATRRINELFDHVKVYREKKVLLHFHDAYEQGWFLISDHVPEAAVSEFANRLGASYRREPNVNKRIEGLRALLKAIENPGRIRIKGETWWRRVWRRWTWR